MKPTVLLQLDPDAQPSVFDSVVAIDAGVSHVLRHGAVRPELVRDLVHGALFTRGGDDLNRTAVFVGGSDVGAAELVHREVRGAFFGPFKVSVLFDPSGCNTTAAAAVLAVMEGSLAKRGTMRGLVVTVLAATGPVGQRVARLLLRMEEVAEVRIGSRQLDRARAVGSLLRQATGRDAMPLATSSAAELVVALADADVVVAAGAAGMRLLPKSSASTARVLIDLNAVPPTGIEGVEPHDRATDRDGRLCWGALGVGSVKMKIHKRAIQALFESKDHLIDAEECLALGRALALS
jgi:hypothetical protein